MPDASWRSMGQYWDSLEYRNSQVVPEDIYSPDGYERRLLEATQLYEPFAPDETHRMWLSGTSSVARSPRRA